MIEIIRVQKGIKYSEEWFSESISFFNIFQIMVYKFYRGENLSSKLGFFKKTSHTLMIDLKQEEEKIFDTFHSKYKNEIRRAIKEDISFEVANRDELEFFREKYNHFAEYRGLTLITEEKLESLNENILLTKSIYNDKILNYHFYVIDNKNVRLQYSIDIEQEGVDRKFYGWSNKFLHYMDICELKEKGYDCYDFGGIAKDTDNKSLEGINNFKIKFGGEVIEEYSYESIVYALFYKIKEKLL
jgi:lipid II:glycine glycyltransferase (peptidoglycan interpeptide bridge formation enzyme)